MPEHCYVIASGPSLLGFDFDALPDGFRIGANRSGWLAKCDAICTVDRNFHMRERERLASFGANAHIALSRVEMAIPGATYWYHAASLEGIALSPGQLSGSNSGFAAFNLAVQLGYTDIALLGFDFKWDGGRSHFHEGYGQKRHIERNLAFWANAFIAAAAQVRHLGVKVTNFVGPMGSNLKSFPTAPLADLL
jgi:ATP-dependent DNA ligase